MTATSREAPNPVWLDQATRLCASIIADRLLSGLGSVWMAPPTIATQVLIDVGYDQAFPQLLTHVRPHTAGDRADPDEAVMSLCPAACYHVYPLYAQGQIPVGEHRDVLAWCYRNEENVSDFRRTNFRMLERVYVADQPMVEAWLDESRHAVRELLSQLGLDTECKAASDPFFGGAGRLLAANQIRQGLKTEFVYEVDRHEVALASLNNHHTHLASAFAIGGGGSPPHSACLAFGLDRLALAVRAANGGRDSTALSILRDLAAGGSAAMI